MAGWLDAFSATQEVEDEDDERDDEEEMDESAGDLERKSAAPQDEEKNGNDE